MRILKVEGGDLGSALGKDITLMNDNYYGVGATSIQFSLKQNKLSYDALKTLVDESLTPYHVSQMGVKLGQTIVVADYNDDLNKNPTSVFGYGSSSIDGENGIYGRVVKQGDDVIRVEMSGSPKPYAVAHAQIVDGAFKGVTGTLYPSGTQVSDNKKDPNNEMIVDFPLFATIQTLANPRA